MPNFEPIGGSGVSIYGGRYDLRYEFNRDIAGERAFGSPTGSVGTLEKMRRTDSTMAMMLRTIKLPLQSTTYGVRWPRGESGPDEIREFVESALFTRPAQSWPAIIRMGSESFDYGNMWAEKVFRVDRDGAVVLDKLHQRLPRSICHWQVAKGELEGIHQLAQVSTDKGEELVFLPADILLGWVYDLQGDAYEGISLMRQAYGPHQIKMQIWRALGIGAEREALGFPVARFGEDSFDDGDLKDQVEEVMRGWRTHEQWYAMVPDTVKFEVIANANSARTDLVELCRYLNFEILSSILAQFLALGSTSTGSRATSDTHVRVWRGAFKSFVHHVVEPFNDVSGRVKHQGLIKELVDLNFGPQDFYPEVFGVVPRAETFKEVADSMAVLSNADFLRANDKDRQQIRQELDLVGVSDDSIEEIVGPEPEPEPAPEPEFAVQDSRKVTHNVTFSKPKCSACDRTLAGELTTPYSVRCPDSTCKHINTHV